MQKHIEAIMYEVRMIALCRGRALAALGSNVH